MNTIIHKTIDWLSYPSTIKGVVSFVGAMGVAISPELADKIVAATLGLVGLIQFFWDDTEKDPAATPPAK